MRGIDSLLRGGMVLVLGVLLPNTSTASVVLTFDGYGPHLNNTPDIAVDTYVTTGAPGEYTYWIYGDAPANGERIGAWSWYDEYGPGYGARADSAGIASEGLLTYAFAEVNCDNPGQGVDLGYVDFPAFRWEVQNPALAPLGAYVGLPHGSVISVFARLVGFDASIQLGFIPNRDLKIDVLVPLDNAASYDPGHLPIMALDYEGPILPATDSFQWYHASVDGFILDYDGGPYSGDRQLGALSIWVRPYSESTAPTLSGQLQIAEIVVTIPEPAAIPEPATLSLVALGGLGLLRRRRRQRI